MYHWIQLTKDKEGDCCSAEPGTVKKPTHMPIIGPEGHSERNYVRNSVRRDSEKLRLEVAIP